MTRLITFLHVLVSGAVVLFHSADIRANASSPEGIYDLVQEEENVRIVLDFFDSSTRHTIVRHDTQSDVIVAECVSSEDLEPNEQGVSIIDNCVAPGSVHYNVYVQRDTDDSDCEHLSYGVIEVEDVAQECPAIENEFNCESSTFEQDHIGCAFTPIATPFSLLVLILEHV